MSLIIKPYYSYNAIGLYVLLMLVGNANNSLLAQSIMEPLTISNEESINTKTLEYCPVIYKDQLIFTSTRPTPGSPMTRWRDEKKQFSDLVKAAIKLAKVIIRRRA